MLRKPQRPEQGFITMIVLMLIVLLVVVFFAYQKVVGS